MKKEIFILGLITIVLCVLDFISINYIECNYITSDVELDNIIKLFIWLFVNTGRILFIFGFLIIIISSFNRIKEKVWNKNLMKLGVYNMFVGISLYSTTYYTYVFLLRENGSCLF